jgi:hypothetical protein
MGLSNTRPDGFNGCSPRRDQRLQRHVCLCHSEEIRSGIHGLYPFLWAQVVYQARGRE